MTEPGSAPDIDAAALGRFLDSTFGAAGAPPLISKISGGQSNPTYFVSHGVQRMALRKKPAGRLLPGAHAIDREYRVMQAVGQAGLPVPRMILFHDDAELLGTSFYLMEWLEGRVFADCSLPGISAGERRAIYLEMADTLARLHAIDPTAIGLADFGRPGNYFQRQIARWTKQWQEASGPAIPELDEIAQWLSVNVPPEDGSISIAHGDFRLGNLLFHPRESRVIAVLDWELSTLGHPLADVGFCCMPWRTAPDEYGGLLGLDVRGLGIPSEEDFTSRYFSHGATRRRVLPFHVAFALFRFAVIFVGIAARARMGNAASENAGAVGHLAAAFARRAVDAARI